MLERNHLKDELKLYERITSKSSETDSDNDHQLKENKKYSSFSSLSSAFYSKSRSRSRTRSSSVDSRHKRSKSSTSREHKTKSSRKRSRSRSNSFNKNHSRHFSSHHHLDNRNKRRSYYSNHQSRHTYKHQQRSKSPSLNKKRNLDENLTCDLKRLKFEQNTTLMLNQINEVTSTDENTKNNNEKKSKKTKEEVRRSARIKHIETKKIHEKETELAEKIKQLNENSNDCSHSPIESPSSSSNQQLTTSDDQTSVQQKMQSPKPFKKMLLNKAFNEVNGVAVSVTLGQQNNDKYDDYKKDLLKLMNENWPKFSYLDENVYLFKYKKSKCNKETKRMTCDCSTSEQERCLGFVPCGEDCLNRMLMIECGSRCACENYCTNKRFQRKEYSFIFPFQTDNKGWGLKALDEIKR